MKVQTSCGEFDEGRYIALRREYNAAIKKKAVMFEFEGHEYLVEFVKYLLEFLRSQFGDYFIDYQK
jgi:hypothetical protein